MGGGGGRMYNCQLYVANLVSDEFYEWSIFHQTTGVYVVIFYQLTSGKLGTNTGSDFIHYLKPLIQSCLVKICALIQVDVRIGCG